MNPKNPWRVRIRVLTVGACFWFLFVPATTWAQAAPFNDSILEDQLRADLTFLASDTMRGRLTGTRGNLLAAEFIRARFARLGLKALGPDNDYYHPFRILTSSRQGVNSIRIETSSLTRNVDDDSFPMRFSPSATAEGSLVFVGFGIRAESRGHDDYRLAKLRGKIALVFHHEPRERDPDSVFDGLVTSELSRDFRKALNAQEAGAVGILFVVDAPNHPEATNFSEIANRTWPAEPRRIPRYTLATWAERVRIPAAEISVAVAEELLSFGNLGMEQAFEAAEVSGGVSAVDIPSVTVRMETRVKRTTLSDRNVVAAVEGTDRKDEWIVICAHYDHDGADGARVFNGADDDGSGTVALLEIAEAYALAAEAGKRPSRSVLFAAWNSEERGLLGAWAYTESPLIPLSQTVATLNMDMIGRNEEVPEGGGRRFRGLEVQTAASNRNAVNLMGQTYSPELRDIVAAANRSIELDLLMRYDNNPSNLLRRSDQWPFLQRGVPALFFHTGLHPDYHTEFDTVSRINFEKMARIARLVHQASWELAETSARPTLIPRGTR